MRSKQVVDFVTNHPVGTKNHIHCFSAAGSRQSAGLTGQTLRSAGDTERESPITFSHNRIRGPRLHRPFLSPSCLTKTPGRESG